MTNSPRFDGDRGLAAAVPGPSGPSGPEGGTQASPTEDVMETLPTEPDGGRSPRPWIGGIIAVLVSPVVLATSLTWGAGTGGAAARAAAARVVSSTDLEQAYGIRVNLVAVTAAGGLVDMRFTVVDKAKASSMLSDHAAMPSLFVQASGRVLQAPAGMGHKITVLDGASYFVLFPNSGGAVQSGTAVSVVIGDVRLEPITAQS